MTDRPTPSSLDSEQIVIGNIMLKPEAFRELESLTPAHFFDHRNQVIFTALNEMDAEGTPIDTYTLKATLESRAELAKAGGDAYLSDLTSNVAQRAHLAHHVRILVDKKQRRDLLMVAHKLMTIAYEPTSSVPKTLEMAQEQLMKISTETNVQHEDIFLDVEKFCNQYHGKVEWTIEGAIEVHTNGIMFGASGDGKSPLVRALAVSLASGIDWLDLRIPKRLRTALISREDYAGTTSRFIKRFRAANGIDSSFNLGAWLWVHSRAQRQSLFVDNPSDLNLIIRNLKDRRIQFCILDVLNVLHQKDEDKNTEMVQVMRCFNRIRDEVGCQVLVLHHVGHRAQESNSVSGAGRGATATSGFGEFKIRIKIEDEDKNINSIRFKVKAGQFQKPIYWKVTDVDERGTPVEDSDSFGVKITREQYESSGGNGKRRAAKA